jgi:hypothetical protein
MEARGVKGYTTKTVAEAVGVSPLTITRWRRAGLVRPQAFKHGKIVAYVFSADDIESCQRIKKTMKAGRRAADDDSVRVTKPPKIPVINRRAVERHALRQSQKGTPTRGKTITDKRVREAQKGA